ncbi:MAG: metallophosphoesterase [Terracoccus sp.]
MSFFVPVLATVLALLTVYLHRRLAVAPGWGRRTRIGTGLVLGLGWLTSLVGFAMLGGVIDPNGRRWLAWAGLTWLAIGVYLLLGVLALGVAALVARLLRRPAARRRVLRAGTPAVAVLAVAATGWGLHEAARPTVTAATVTSPDLPEAFDGLRIALLTDLHAGPVRDATFTRAAVDAINAAEPDLVVLGGDLVDGKVEQVADVLAPLADLEAPLGVVAVSGNHEYISQEADAWLAHWETLGITVLRNDSLVLTDPAGGTETIRVAGINDLTATGDAAPDPDLALRDSDPAGFTLLVAHQPKSAELVQGRGVDLQLSGHTHGGQLWPFRWAVLLQQPVIDGLDAVGDVPVLTSRGAGAWGPPVRVLAPPEIPVVTVRRG